MPFIVTKSRSGDFASGLNTGQLHKEIENDTGIVANILSISTNSDVINIKFETEPDANDLTNLETRILAHVPKPIYKITKVVSEARSSHSTQETSWLTLETFLFAGTNHVDSIIDSLFSSRKDASVTNYRLRLQDVTNSATIAMSDQLTNDTDAFYTLGEITNLPEEAAMFEWQIEVVGGSGKNKSAYVNAFQLRSL